MTTNVKLPPVDSSAFPAPEARSGISRSKHQVEALLFNQPRRARKRRDTKALPQAGPKRGKQSNRDQLSLIGVEDYYRLTFFQKESFKNL
jgi:hypothetical protein